MNPCVNDMAALQPVDEAHCQVWQAERCWESLQAFAANNMAFGSTIASRLRDICKALARCHRLCLGTLMRALAHVFIKVTAILVCVAARYGLQFKLSSLEPFASSISNRLSFPPSQFNNRSKGFRLTRKLSLPPSNLAHPPRILIRCPRHNLNHLARRKTQISLRLSFIIIQRRRCLRQWNATEPRWLWLWRRWCRALSFGDRSPVSAR